MEAGYYCASLYQRIVTEISAKFSKLELKRADSLGGL